MRTGHQLLVIVGAGGARDGIGSFLPTFPPVARPPDAAGTPFEFDGQTFPVTVSLGVTVLKSANPDLERLVMSADSALYQAKRDGRNRVYAAKG